MARTIKEIHDSMIADFQSRPELAVFTSPSSAAMWRHFLYIVAVCTFALEKLFDSHKQEVNDIIATKNAHGLGWYAYQAKRFQYGRALIKDTDQYDNTGLTDEEIAAEQVIKFAAATRVYDAVNILKGIRLKLATIDGDDLAKVSDAQMNAFNAYANVDKVFDAGVNLYIYSGDPDSLKMSLDIYYDPLVLTTDGKRIDGTSDTPVLDAINDYLKNDIAFDGTFVTSAMVDKIQAVEGVKIPYVSSIQATYGVLPYTDIPVLYHPDAGYLRIIDPDTDLVINYIPY